MATQAAAYIPRFCMIEGWEDSLRSHNQPSGSLPPDKAMAASVADLCRFFHARFTPSSIWIANRSPLAWPAIFSEPRINPTRQRLEIESLLSANHLKNRELVALEPAQIADSLKAAIAAGTPVLANAPGSPVLFGYDDREPDPWWWLSFDGRTELILESERLSRLVFWDDDPAAGVMWVVTGIDPSAPRSASGPSADWEFLRHVSVSARGDLARGIQPYPLSIRDLRDQFAEAPLSVFPTDLTAPSDPYGVRRAITAREQAETVLERLTRSESDTSLSAPLRLAQYCGHNSLMALRQLADTLYGDPVGVAPDRLPIDHVDPKTRLAVANLLTEVLRWEKQMVEQIDRALLASEVDETPPPKKPPAKKPGRRRR
ncbi:MAG: hypothetical protein AB1792_02750 [Candidatus Zixiibacteriota bacterium]